MRVRVTFVVREHLGRRQHDAVLEACDGVVEGFVLRRPARPCRRLGELHVEGHSLRVTGADRVQELGVQRRAGRASEAGGRRRTAGRSPRRRRPSGGLGFRGSRSSRPPIAAAGPRRSRSGMRRRSARGRWRQPRPPGTASSATTDGACPFAQDTVVSLPSPGVCRTLSSDPRRQEVRPHDN